MADGGLLATDDAGRLHRFDDQLRLLASSIPQTNVPFYTITHDDSVAVGRDKLGNFAKWDVTTLRLLDWLPSGTTADRSTLMEDEAPSLTISRGIVIHDGLVYANNGYLQLVVLDLDSFSVVDIRPSPSGDIPLEWICTDHPTIHAITDKDGRLFLGDLPSNYFPTVLRLDDKSNLHRVRYDHMHDRFWVIQDEGSGEQTSVSTGVVTVNTDGTVDQELRFALDDIESLDISPDGLHMYAGGFDSVLAVFDNSSPELRIEQSIEGFRHQISDIAIRTGGSFDVLCQDGSLTRLSKDGEVLATLPFARQCVWDAWLSPIRDVNAQGSRQLLLAMDNGVARAEVHWTSHSIPGIKLLHVSEAPEAGFNRRVVGGPDGSHTTITRGSEVRHFNKDGDLQWTKKVASLLHSLSVSPDGRFIAVATNGGTIELIAATGDTVSTFTVDGSPTWCCLYTSDGHLLVASHGGAVNVLSPQPQREVLHSFEIGDYPKRIQQLPSGELIVAGGGGARQFSYPAGDLEHHWEELLSNTCENAIVVGDFLYAITYDSQLAAFHRHSGELIGVLEGTLPDFPKALVSVRSPAGDNYLLIGGRGGYIAFFRVLSDGTVELTRMQWLPTEGMTVPPALKTVS